MGFKAKLYLHQVRTRKLMGFKNQAVPTPGSNSGLRKKFARFRPERHFPRSAGWEGREVLVVIRTVCSQLMGFAKTCMTQPGFEPATFAFQTAAKTARLRELLLLARATISGYIPSITQLGFEPATFANRNGNRTRCMTQPGCDPATFAPD